MQGVRKLEGRNDCVPASFNLRDWCGDGVDVRYNCDCEMRKDIVNVKDDIDFPRGKTTGKYEAGCLYEANGRSFNIPTTGYRVTYEFSEDLSNGTITNTGGFIHSQGPFDTGMGNIPDGVGVYYCKGRVTFFDDYNTYTRTVLHQSGPVVDVCKFLFG